MDKNEYVKGERNEIVNRINNVHTITLKCPLDDYGIRCFRATLISCLLGYMNNEDNHVFNRIPTDDVYNAFIYTLSFCRENDIDVQKLYVVCSYFQSFKFLRYINICFCDDDYISKKYEDMKFLPSVTPKQVDIMSDIYKIDIIEFNLINMFNQNIIDLFNKSLIENEIISNSYLKRSFEIYFNFDDYISFMNMFLNNNGIMFESMDKRIIEYFRLFPVYIMNNEPIVKIVTNYKDI